MLRDQAFWIIRKKACRNTSKEKECWFNAIKPGSLIFRRVSINKNPSRKRQKMHLDCLAANIDIFFSEIYLHLLSRTRLITVRRYSCPTTVQFPSQLQKSSRIRSHFSSIASRFLCLGVNGRFFLLTYFRKVFLETPINSAICRIDRPISERVRICSIWVLVSMEEDKFCFENLIFP